MAYLACDDCGEKVANLAAHYAVCKKRKRESKGIVRARVDAATRCDPEKVVAATVKTRGRPPIHTKCRICGGPHKAKGLCLNHYQQEYDRAHRE